MADYRAQRGRRPGAVRSVRDGRLGLRVAVPEMPLADGVELEVDAISRLLLQRRAIARQVPIGLLLECILVDALDREGAPR